MQDYYRLLGVSRVSTPQKIKQAYRRTIARPTATMPVEEATDYRQTVQAAYDLFQDPVRRAQYDAWLAQQPDTRSAAMRAKDQQRLQTFGYARYARWLLWTLLAGSLLLITDWAIPAQPLEGEQLLSQTPVSIGSLQEPATGYDVATTHTTFRLTSTTHALLNDVSHVTVWRTPLLHVVRRLRPPQADLAQPAIQPISWPLYNSMLVATLFLTLLCAATGLVPTITPELRVNLAVVGILMTFIIVIIVWAS